MRSIPRSSLFELNMILGHFRCLWATCTIYVLLYLGMKKFHTTQTLFLWVSYKILMNSHKWYAYKFLIILSSFPQLAIRIVVSTIGSISQSSAKLMPTHGPSERFQWTSDRSNTARHYHHQAQYPSPRGAFVARFICFMRFPPILKNICQTWIFSPISR